MKNHAKFTAEFIKEFSIKHDMPELRGMMPQTSVKKSSEELSCVEAEIEVTPRGQMAALVKELEVKVSSFLGADGSMTVEVHMSYKHHGGGSNGKSVSFRVVHDGTNYQGFVTHDQFRQIREMDEKFLDYYRNKGF
jgi:hypothetical protein